MSDINPYLWDGSGAPDPEVQRLESVLTPLRYSRPLAFSAAAPSRWRGLRLVWYAAAAAATAAAVLVALALPHARPDLLQPRQSWQVRPLQGRPEIESVPLEGKGRLPVGKVLHTGAQSSALLKIGRIGSLEVRPNSVLRLTRSRGGKYEVALLRGSIAARTWAPPFTFSVLSAAGRVSDLGCSFEMEVGEDGAGIVRVRSGWVELERNFRESLVPAGAAARMRPGWAPGTPYFEDSSPVFQAALEQLDFGPPDPATRAAALSLLLAEARPRDVYTLMRLLHRSTGKERAQLVDRAAQLVPFPPGVTREGVLAQNTAMLNAWYEQLGLTNVKRWWVHWRDALPL